MRLLIKGIFVKAKRSVLAPAISLSEKWSSAADMTLQRRQPPTHSGNGPVGHLPGVLPPTHLFAKLDYSRGEALARLREGLHGASWHVVFAGDDVDRHLVAQVPKLECEIEPAVDPGQVPLLLAAFPQ